MMSGFGFPFLNNGDCDRAKACGCGGFGGCDSGCNSGCNSGCDKGCGWGGKFGMFGKRSHKGCGCNKGCDNDDNSWGLGNFCGFDGLNW